MLPKSRRRLTLGAIALSVFAAVPTWGQVINEDLKLEASDGAGGDKFGWDIAVDNGIVAVAARDDDDSGSGLVNSGSVYLFDASTGAQLFMLLAKDRRTNDFFGRSVAMDNGVVAVGANGDDDNGSLSGSAYLFDVITSAQLRKLLPDDGAIDDQFGYSIAIDNGVVAVGARFDDDNGINSGSAYLFDVSTGDQLFKLLPSDGAVGDNFGESVAIDAGLVVVGAISSDHNGGNSGSAYLFDAPTGDQLFRLLPNDGAASDNFGISVAIDNGVVVVGAWAGDDNGSSSGSVYLFDASTGAQIDKLLASDGAQNDHLGEFVSIDSGVVAATASTNGDNGQNSGSAYLFDASTGTQIAKLLPSDGAMSDFFGESIDIKDGVVVVGAPFEDDPGTDSGAAYVFSAPGTGCPADLNNDGVLNFFDVSVFLQGFANQDPIADFTSDGLFNFFDVSAFLQAFNEGCP